MSTTYNRPPVDISRRLTLTVSEACEVSGLGRSSVYELIKAGTIPTSRVAGRRLILVEPFKKLLGAA